MCGHTIKLRMGNNRKIISEDGSFLFGRKRSNNSHVISYRNKYTIKREAKFLMDLFDKRKYRIFNEQDEYIGTVETKGLRKLRIDINTQEKRLFAKVRLIKRMFIREKVFHVESTTYKKKKDYIELNSNDNIDDFKVFAGCCILYFSNKIGNYDNSFDLGD